MAGSEQSPSSNQVLVCPANTHMNNEIFHNPTVFDPTRFGKDAPSPTAFSLVPFGAGLRMCPGMEVAKMETLALIHHLVTKFTWELLKKDESFKRVPVPEFDQGLLARIKPKGSCKHISIWVAYLNETRARDADWCIVDSWFIPLLMRGDISHVYGDGRRFKVLWGEVRRVFIPINNAGKHWTLGEFDVATGVITIYDSLHGALLEDEDKIWVGDMMEKVKAKLPSYLEGLGVFEKKGIDSCSYNIRFEIFPQYLTPQQGALYGDCGVFVCIFLYRLSHGLDLDIGDPIQAALAYRERMANLVLEYKERVYV